MPTLDREVAILDAQPDRDGGAMSATAVMRTGRLRLDWRKAGLAAAAAGLNVGAIALLSLTDLGLRERSVRDTPMIVYLDDAWPTLARAPQRLAESPQLARSRVAPDADAPAAPVIVPSPSTTAEPIPAAPDDVQDEWRVRPLAALGRRGPGLPLDCSAPQLLAAEAQRLCRERSIRMADGARSLSGSGDAGRDAAFARQGARRLAQWEYRRSDPSVAEPSGCVQMGPVLDCDGVNVQVELFSSRDGFLPNLRKRRE